MIIFTSDDGSYSTLVYNVWLHNKIKTTKFLCTIGQGVQKNKCTENRPLQALIIHDENNNLRINSHNLIHIQ